jgi:hypothetical protein
MWTWAKEITREAGPDRRRPTFNDPPLIFFFFVIPTERKILSTVLTLFFAFKAVEQTQIFEQN